MKSFISVTIKRNITLSCALISVVLIIIFSEKVKSAAAEAVSCCLNMVIPCIFPMTVLSFFIIENGLPVKLLSFTDKNLSRYFGLSGNCLEALLTGLTGGYNTAVKVSLKLKENGRITQEQSKRIALFFTNPGISFTVLLTGFSLNGSLNKGLRVYFETVILSIVFAYIYNRFNRYSVRIPLSECKSGICDALISAVDSASKAIISISFNIIFFAVITCITGIILPYSPFKELILLTSEVSSAVIYSSEHFPFFVTAGVVTFGGLCIFMQNLSDLKKLNISSSAFIVIRLIYALTVYLTEYILSLFFPQTELSYSPFSIRISASESSVGALSLIFLCTVYLFSIRNTLRHKNTTKKVK